jgi:hypothetical protein
MERTDLMCNFSSKEDVWKNSTAVRYDTDWIFERHGTIVVLTKVEATLDAQEVIQLGFDHWALLRESFIISNQINFPLHNSTLLLFTWNLVTVLPHFHVLLYVHTRHSELVMDDLIVWLKSVLR